MPTLRSAAKRMRQSARLRVENLNVRTSIKSLRSAMFKAISSKDKAVAVKLYPEYCSLLDKSAKKGVIKRNTAIRRKARAAAQLRAL